MYGAGRDKDAVADARFDRMQHGLPITGRDGLNELFATNALGEPAVELGSGVGGEDVPGLGLAEVGRVEGRPHGVVGVDLHAELAIGVEKLQQQRKSIAGRRVAVELARQLFVQTAQRPTGERPGGDDALIVAMVDHLPALGIVVSRANRLAEHRSQAAPSPQVAAKLRLESKRVERSGHLVSLT